MPKLVYANVSALKTLPPEQFSAGMGEVIKHGLIRDQEYYEWILENKEAVRNRELSVCRRLICGSNRIKRQVVEADPTEQNERAVLNFGHTLGHAVEKLKDFSHAPWPLCCPGSPGGPGYLCEAGNGAGGRG